MTAPPATPERPGGADLRRFAEAYAAHRAEEGRGRGGGDELRALPWLREGPLARQWSVRARTFERFVEDVVRPMARSAGRPELHVLDAGSGNGWLCYRLAGMGHHAVALDARTDHVDGLGAAEGYRGVLQSLFTRVAGSFEAPPLRSGTFDLVVFNASLHYAVDLARTVEQAARLLAPEGAVVVLDSPFYRRAEDGEAMIAEKRAAAHERFGSRADALMSLPSVEYLTAARLVEASRTTGLAWKRRRVRYPLWYELRPLGAALRRRRPPSRFDLWVGTRSRRSGS